MRPLSVLFTNSTLGGRSGSETYIRDAAVALLRRGHQPVAFSLVLGDVAAELRRATVPVVNDLSRLTVPPDVIHGHHHLETLIAALTFPAAPIVHFCHGWIPWEEKPLRHPSIATYVAVDDVCLDRLVKEEGIPRERIEVLRNFVDLDRFQPRASLPPKPARALVLSNYASPDGYVRTIGAACATAGISLDVVGGAHGGTTDSPETLLPGYDVVFAKGRTALEALSVGCAVVVADAAGAGPMVTRENFEALRGNNFGIRELHRPHAASWYREQLASYDPCAASEIRSRVRAEAGLDGAVERLITLYESAIAAPRQAGDGSLAAARHVSVIAQPLKDASRLTVRVNEREHDVEILRTECEQHAATVTALTDAIGALKRDLEEARSRERELEVRTCLLQTQLSQARLISERVSVIDRELMASRDHEQALEAELARFRALPTLRVRDAVLRLPVIGSTLQAAARRLARARS